MDSPYGVMDLSINLSKPEKDQKAIAAAKNAKQSGYPKCLLCMENVGYAGHVSHPARQTHRIIPLTIHGTDWGLQYSPYVYYNEHCILFNGEHVPMKIERATFVKLFDFVKQFPHYFIGSNADLPIVGGAEVGIAYDPMNTDTKKVLYRDMEPVTAHRVRIDAFCDKTPDVPVGMTETVPETSRFLDALEKKYREDHQLMANALSFGEYGKAGGSHV